jgi:glyoxylase-like metal-dependent hydrolase (beta-lactamase superfamily II)
MDISPLELAEAFERGAAVQVLDVRAESRVALGRIEVPATATFHNIRGSRVRQLDSLSGTGLDPAVPMAVVCGHGNDSRAVANHLNTLGARARSLRGGMAAWMNVVLPRELQAPAGLDRFVQFDRIGKGALGYLLVSDGEALIVDPPRDPGAYLAAAQSSRARVVGVADTHVHADYISGAPALAERLGVPYYLHPADAVHPYDGTPGRIEFTAIDDGTVIRVGRCTVGVAHTPGHTEGSVTCLVDDAAALTGDFFFVGSVGRPDLAGKTAEWTIRLWESLEGARRDWSPDLLICPAHYASETERRADRSVAAVLGDLLRENPVLRLRERTAFAGWIDANAGMFPEVYRTIKAVNVGLAQVDDREAETLEVGRNECALGGLPDHA